MSTPVTPDTVLIALLLAAVGFVILGTLLSLMWRGARGSFAPWWEQKTIAQKERVVSFIEQLVQEGKATLIAPQLQSALVLDRVSTSSRLVERAHGVHLSLVGQLMDLASKNSTHFVALPVIEDLFVSRRDLQLSILDTRTSLIALLQQKNDPRSTKDTPEWALAELRSRLAEMEDKLKTNSRSLMIKIRELEDELQAMGDSQTVLYH